MSRGLGQGTKSGTHQDLVLPRIFRIRHEIEIRLPVMKTVANERYITQVSDLELPEGY